MTISDFTINKYDKTPTTELAFFLETNIRNKHGERSTLFNFNTKSMRSESQRKD